MTIQIELDRIQRQLQDEGSIWPRAELLDWLRDGSLHLLAETSATRRFTILEVPPRFAWSITFPWEAAFIGDSTPHVWAHQGVGGWAGNQWELELLEGITPTASGILTTQPWERTFENPTQQPFRFGVPRDAERIVRLWYNNRLLVPLSVRALDGLETTWYSLEGLPVAWTTGVGPHRTFEVYEIVTNYEANYRYTDAVTNEGNPLHGTLRRLSGDRTYAWESASGDTVPYGIARRLSSPDRQYLPRWGETDRNPVGRAGWIAGSQDALLLLEAVIPDQGTLLEADELALLPPQLAKYCRYYALFRAYNRQGEGYHPLLAAWYEQRYMRGVVLLRKLHQLAMHDRQVARQPVQSGRRRPPRVRLPSNYPAVLPW